MAKKSIASNNPTSNSSTTCTTGNWTARVRIFPDVVPACDYDEPDSALDTIEKVQLIVSLQKKGDERETAVSYCTPTYLGATFLVEKAVYQLEQLFLTGDKTPDELDLMRCCKNIVRAYRYESVSTTIDRREREGARIAAQVKAGNPDVSA